MLDARPEHRDKLEFVQIKDFEESADFTEAVRGVGAVIHTASVRINRLYLVEVSRAVLTPIAKRSL